MPYRHRVELTDRAVVSAENALAELGAVAQLETDRCWGYFRPEDAQLSPSAAEFAEEMDVITIDGVEYPFSFLRLSLQAQPANVPGSLHIDATSAAGMGDYQDGVEVWRVLLNLSTEHQRAVSYTTQSPFDPSLTLVEADQLRTSTDFNQIFKTEIVMPPRVGNIAHAVTLCASHILHGGNDTEDGHYLAAFGKEISA